MKYTLFALASMATLTSAVNAQTYTMLYDQGVSDHAIAYASLTDFAANTQAGSVAIGFDISAGPVRGFTQNLDGSYTVINDQGGTGYAITYASLADMATNTQAGSVAIGFDISAGPVRGFAQNPDGSYTLISDQAGTGYAITYASLADLTANTQASSEALVFSTGSARGFTSSIVDPVPEPSSAALLGLGGLALILRRRK